MIVFGLLAAAFAMLGVYGVVSRSVGRRTREIGIRTALGAGRNEVLSMIMTQGLGLAAMGILFGMILSLFATRLLESLLFGVSRTDPVSLLGICGIVALFAVCAALPPSRRALGIDPAEALRSE